jgi:hypothetical protein
MWANGGEYCGVVVKGVTCAGGFAPERESLAQT